MANESRLDVIIFGASGFTGKYCVLEATRVLKDLSWGIAGRNKTKLENIIKEMSDKAKTDLSHVSITLADIADEKSLKEMASKCKVLVNCCGPYRLYGEPVIKACLESNTHHVDVSGEPQYMESIQLKYFDEAKQKGIYIISACGFDSIPADMGTVFVENKFEGVVNSIETYLEFWENGGQKEGASIHFGTWESAVYGLAYANELRDIRSKLFEKELPRLAPRLKSKPLIHKSDVVKGSYCLPFPGSDRSVVMRSQRILYEMDKKRPIQMKAYVAFRNLFATIMVAIFAAIFGIMTKFSIGRTLLLRFPKFFSAGFFSHEGPSEAKMNNSKFRFRLYAQGWNNKDKMAEPTTDVNTISPSKTMIAEVTGHNPGYGATCVALLVSAVTILRENSKMHGTGGVYPPGAAFAKTNLIEELGKYDNGLKFKIVSVKDTRTEQ